eukprot:scaffold136838_cov33-Tisochrysis_lutea.AAC.2
MSWRELELMSNELKGRGAGLVLKRHAVHNNVVCDVEASVQCKDPGLGALEEHSARKVKDSK